MVRWEITVAESSVKTGKETIAIGNAACYQTTGFAKARDLSEKFAWIVLVF